MQSAHGPAFITYRSLEEKLDEMRVISGGRLDISLFPAGAIVPAMELLEAVAKNTLETSHTFTGYWGGLEPALAMLGNMRMGISGEDYMTWYYQYDGGRFHRDWAAENGNSHVVGWWGHGVEPINSTIPLDRIEDFEGTKGRMGGSFGVVIEAIGGQTMMVATPEAYTSLQTGVIDWADAGDIVSNWDMGLQEVCPYLVFTGFHQNTSMGYVDVNMDKWNELPEDLKALFEMAMRALAEELREREDWQSAVIMEKHLEYGTTIVTWPDSELARVTEIATGIILASRDSPRNCLLNWRRWLPSTFRVPTSLARSMARAADKLT